MEFAPRSCRNCTHRRRHEAPPSMLQARGDPCAAHCRRIRKTAAAWQRAKGRGNFSGNSNRPLASERRPSRRRPPAAPPAPRRQCCGSILRGHEPTLPNTDRGGGGYKPPRGQPKGPRVRKGAAWGGCSFWCGRSVFPPHFSFHLSIKLPQCRAGARPLWCGGGPGPSTLRYSQVAARARGAAETHLEPSKITNISTFVPPRNH